MTVEILRGDIHLIDLRTRIPFKYGIATMTAPPHAFVRMFVRVDGREHVGIAADHLPPKWFTKDPDRGLDDEIDEMLLVVEHAVEIAAGLRGESAFDLWQQLYAAQSEWGERHGYPALLQNFGTSLVERAVIEAVCKAARLPFATMVRQNRLGIRLGDFEDTLAGFDPADLLPPEPLRRTIARHTVGMADYLTPQGIPDDERVDDGLPQALSECIARYGLKHFKLKVLCDPAADVERLERLLHVIEEGTRGNYAVSIDGNELCRSVEHFRDYWDALRQTVSLRPLLDRLLCVEQPFHRDIALDCDVLADLRSWSDRPPLIIDESDSSIESLPTALELGYCGTSHKNCKGVFSGVAHACLLEACRRENPRGNYVMTGEDLVNVGPVALLQDMAVAATLGVTSLERNGHHFLAGLSAHSNEVQQQVLAAHGDVYAASRDGWPSMTIEGGTISLASTVDAPFGVGFKLDVEQFIPSEQWKRNRAQQ
ncbi:MAG: hypothetical protein CMJ48_00090 [Planctomycetaceae bacterium]|nr:hypothetical protein [Planctomycetaceae bacterium]